MLNVTRKNWIKKDRGEGLKMKWEDSGIIMDAVVILSGLFSNITRSILCKRSAKVARLLQLAIFLFRNRFTKNLFLFL